MCVMLNVCDAQCVSLSHKIQPSFVSTLSEETDAMSLKQHTERNWGQKHKQNRENCMVVLNVCIITHNTALSALWLKGQMPMSLKQSRKRNQTKTFKNIMVRNIVMYYTKPSFVNTLA